MIPGKCKVWSLSPETIRDRDGTLKEGRITVINGSIIFGKRFM